MGEQELQRRITAINAVTLYCGVEEGAPSRHVQRGPPGTVVRSPVQAAEPDATYSNPGSLSRHFRRYHVSKLQVGQFIDCMDCGVRLETRTELLIHAERFHGTVSRVPAERLIVWITVNF